MSDETRTTPDSLRLLPCPFCGGIPDETQFGALIWCNNCIEDSRGLYTRKTWNTRSTPPPSALREAAEIARLDRRLDETMTERDLAEEAVSRIFFEIVGRSPEWSNNFGYPEIIEEIMDRVNAARAALSSPQAKDGEGASEGENTYGVDVGYFRRELAALSRSLPKRTKAELERYLTHLAAIVSTGPITSRKDQSYGERTEPSREEGGA